MKRRRISPIGIAGILAILSALGLIVLISSGGVFTNIDPTAQQQTVDAIVHTRLTQTAEMRQVATAETTDQAVGAVAETEAAKRTLTPVTSAANDVTPPPLAASAAPTSTPENS